jgi:ABC-type Zn2+ transport system substrate-binding protein/surface adhesin
LFFDHDNDDHEHEHNNDHNDDHEHEHNDDHNDDHDHDLAADTSTATLHHRHEQIWPLDSKATGQGELLVRPWSDQAVDSKPSNLHYLGSAR